MKKQAQFSRKGSALLIVLGMLAFMVVSAVSFSIYMRESRVPSSHLRRESTARYLLKSALANAVARLNGNFKTRYEIWGETDPSGKHYNYLDTSGYVEGLYDDQYPGLNDFTVLGHNGDYWTKRVFTPFGQVAPTTTVSTLTLEGLAYLPPAIINEARVFSRTTRTAQWENLAYDLGRYAFCAIDVSDCFDINKLATAKRRTSHPSERISLTSLYSHYPTDKRSLAFADLDLIEGKIRDTPFVSLADFNVAMGTKSFTPFARYINNGGNNGNIYLDDDVIVSNALFITDTWFPATNAYLTAELELETPPANASRNFDLSKKEDQPFAESDFGCASILEVPTTGRMQQIMKANLGLVGYTCLYDYLDGDRVPLSLALPTVEAVPMVCGVQIVGSMPFTFRKNNDDLPKDYPAKYEWSCPHPQNPTDVHTIERITEAVCFEGAEPENARVVGTVMYPFKRMSQEQRQGTFKVQALVGAFFGDAALKCRVENEKFRPTEKDWNGGICDGGGIAFYKTTPVSLSLPNDISQTSDAFIQFECDISEMNVCMPAYYIVKEKDLSLANGDSDKALPADYLDAEVLTADGLSQVKNALTLFDADGNTLANWDTAKKGRLYTKAERAANPTGTRQADVKGVSLGENGMAPYLAVWVRVLDENNNTVDLSPATFCDDEIWLEDCDYGGNADTTLAEFCGPNVALLDFRGEQRFSFTESDPLTTFDANTALKFEGWDALFAPDPRYNFAPEDWFGKLGTSATKGNCQQVVESVLGVNNRDRDIFMFTSDQEHLQSIGELQFLPYVQDFGQNITGTASDFCRGARYNADGNFAARTTSDLDKEGAGMFANSSRFWRTYSGYNNTSSNRKDNPYYDLRNGGQVSVVNGTGGFRVNPLSPDMRVISAAIFDTPWDYYVASTNTRTNKIISEAESQPESYAFGDASSRSADKWSEGAVSQIARAICEGTRSDAIKWMQQPARRKYPFDWGGYYEDLWADYADEDPEYLFGYKLGSGCKLHDVDRKFLFSFWRDCFQNRQQLFLIFLRAEPLAAGAGGVSNAQLGARGVALVWRDPAPPKSNTERMARGEITDRQDWLDQLKNCPPHRTRVLFYHQFE